MIFILQGSGSISWHFYKKRRVLIFSNEKKPFFLFCSVKWDTPHLSVAPALHIHWEWAVILQTLMYFTESTLLFISCNCSQSRLPGETRCWNRGAASKKYSLLKPRVALWIKKCHFELHLETRRRGAQPLGRGCKRGKEEQRRGGRSHLRRPRILRVCWERAGCDWEQLRAQPGAALPIRSRWWIWCRLTGRKIYFWGEKQLLLKAGQWSWTGATRA